MTVDPAEYIRCARLRRQVCPVFADVTIDEERVSQQWPEPGVPRGIAESAQAMDTLRTLTPNLDWPASMRAPSCQLPREDDGAINVVADNVAIQLGQSLNVDAAAAEHSAPSNDSPVCNESGLPLDLPAESHRRAGVRHTRPRGPHGGLPKQNWYLFTSWVLKCMRQRRSAHTLLQTPPRRQQLGERLRRQQRQALPPQPQMSQHRERLMPQPS